MKTDNIYIARLGYATKVDSEGGLRDYLFGDGIKYKARYMSLKYVIVKKDKYSDEIAVDLVTKNKYLCETPLEAGVLFLPPARMIPFAAIYPEEKANLPKKKILTLGKQAIEEFKKIENEQKNK